MSNSDPTPLIGDMYVYDRAIPAFKQGEYVLNTVQDFPGYHSDPLHTKYEVLMELTGLAFEYNDPKSSKVGAYDWIEKVYSEWLIELPDYGTDDFVWPPTIPYAVCGLNNSWKIQQNWPLIENEVINILKLRDQQFESITKDPGGVLVEHHFNVVGPRFRLTPDDVNSVYPPPYEPDAQTFRIPMVVLERYTLPWEIDLFNGVNSDKLCSHLWNSESKPEDESDKRQEWPYMALLLFTEDELNSDTDVKKGTLAHVIPSTKIGDMEITDPNMEVSYIEVQTSILRDVVPTLDEVKFLSHVRRVNTSDSELCGDDEDGWLSVITGNRLITESNTKYTACLVSLEGRVDEPFMPQKKGVVQKPDPLMSVDYTRLVLLHHWSFTSGEGGDFQSTMKGLDSGLFGKGLSDVEFKYNGHIPMELIDQAGNKRTVLYRGPLTAMNVEYSEKNHPYRNSDEALAVDWVCGEEEYSHGSAFELGRMLCMSNKGMMQDMALWRRTMFMREVKFKLTDAFKPLFHVDHDNYSIHQELSMKEVFEKLVNEAHHLITPEVLEGLVDPAKYPPGYVDPNPGGDMTKMPIAGLDISYIDDHSTEKMSDDIKNGGKLVGNHLDKAHHHGNMPPDGHDDNPEGDFP